MFFEIKEGADTKFNYKYGDGVLNIWLFKVIEDNELAVGTTYIVGEIKADVCLT